MELTAQVIAEANTSRLKGGLLRAPQPRPDHGGGLGLEAGMA
jgi:hypothetical protein